MNHQNDWNEEEDNFDLTLSQRTEELYRVPNMEPNADGLIEAVVLPLRDMVIFPRMVSPIFVGREASLLAVQEAQRKEQTVIGLTQKDPELNEPSAEDFLPVGVEMAVGRLLAHARRLILCAGAGTQARGDRRVPEREAVSQSARARDQ